MHPSQYQISYQDYYSTPYVRQVCHGVKQHEDLHLQQACIHNIAVYFASPGFLNRHCFLVPAPQHWGRAGYMRSIAERTAELTGAKVLDIAECIPHKPIYKQKEYTNPEAIFLVRTGELDQAPQGSRFIFLDNVISTGYTFAKINRICNNRLFPLAYAIDSRKLQLMPADKELANFLLRHTSNTTAVR